MVSWSQPIQGSWCQPAFKEGGVGPKESQGFSWPSWVIYTNLKQVCLSEVSFISVVIPLLTNEDVITVYSNHLKALSPFERKEKVQLAVTDFLNSYWDTSKKNDFWKASALGYRIKSIAYRLPEERHLLLLIEFTSYSALLLLSTRKVREQCSLLGLSCSDISC